MVSARLVDRCDSPEEHPVRSIPEMMFAVGEEPVGVRVLTYLSSGAINRIYNALEDEEILIIRDSAFGKILDLVDKPVFSGRFARYILSRQLKTRKKHEAWFRFAGKPIRFSLREFAIVTGLPCGKFPLKSKMKLKKSISEKPYWPSLFGKVDVVTVDSVLRMLRKHTVQERYVRIKYACLAILSSVLLPTNINMKICREHVEAIEDLDEFFAYPWGRLAFDMLMSSIKEKDVIALSQDNFAVKGFVLALQLVMVEAVPCLYEVVQEMCSSSECDSDDDDDEKSYRGKRKTLSPGHARNVDKRTDVLVRSIIEEDPLRPIDESQLVYSDEEEDEKVNNLVYLINTNFQFPKSVYVGGVTKIDIDRMRDGFSGGSKLKKSKKQVASSGRNDPGYIASLVMQKIKPEFKTMRGNIHEACKRIESIEGSVPALVHSLVGNFKDEVLELVKKFVSELTNAEDVGSPSISKKGTKPATMINANRPASNDGEGIDGNAGMIRDILGNLSEYSTPPASPRLSLGENVGTVYDKVIENSDGIADKGDETVALSGHSQNNQRSIDLNQPMEVANKVHRPVIETPSFSLGLTQEEQLHVSEGVNGGGFLSPVPRLNFNVLDTVDVVHQSRKSKRQKCVPQALVTDYHCGREIMTRVRKSQKLIFAFDAENEINRKYSSLLEEVYQEGVFKFAGLRVTAKDIREISERLRLCSAKVLDLMIQLLQTSIELHFHPDISHRNVYLDSRYVSAVGRLYIKFSKSKKKESLRFPKCLLQYFASESGRKVEQRRYYFPLNIFKRHWVGVCVDHSSGKITVLDCNTKLFSDSMIEKQLYPHMVMIPYLIRECSEASRCEDPIPLSFERPKGLSQSEDPFNCGLMAVLLMGTHAVYGIEACKNIHQSMLEEEGKSAAIMAFELRDGN